MMLEVQPYRKILGAQHAIKHGQWLGKYGQIVSRQPTDPLWAEP